MEDSFLESLVRNLVESDFGVFIFGADDATTKRDSFLKSPRDNVVYEAGLFSGYLGPKRCFIAVPQQTKVHVPSDLSGMKLGFYEDDRADGNDRAAVNAFCAEMRKQIDEQGLFKGRPRDRLRDLATQFECCDWIADEGARVQKKRTIAAEIEQFCRENPANKRRLLAQKRVGYNIALFSTIRFRPEKRDCELIKAIQTNTLPPGFAYYKLMDAVEAIKSGAGATQEQLSELQAWLKTLPKASPDIAQRIENLTK